MKSNFKVPTLHNDAPRFKQTRVWKFEEAPDDLKEKIIEKLRNNKFEENDDFFAQDEGIIFDKDEKKDGHDIGLKNLFPSRWDVGGNRGDDFIQFDELEIDNKKKFVDYLGLSKDLRAGEQLAKIDVEFRNDRESNNTALQFTDVNGSNISLAGDRGALFEHYGEEDDLPEDEKMFNKEDVPTQEEFDSMLRAHDKFADLMDDALIHLRNNYDFQFTDEALEEDATANEYDFDEDGNIA